MDFKTQAAYLQEASSAIAQATAMNTTAVMANNTAPDVVAPKMVAFDFAGTPKFDASGVCTEDFWMVGKTGCKVGALYPHWQVYNTSVTIMGGVTEYDVVCPPDPTNAVQMNPSNYNSCVHHAWEKQVGWVTNPPAGLAPNAVVTEEIRAGWAAWDKQFKASHGL